MTSPPADQPLLGEAAIVQGFLAPLAAGLPGAFGLLDDCAALTPPPGSDLVIKTDPVRAGVHFFADDDPADIGWKALAVNVSDLAAKGAVPLGYTLALAFPEAPTARWMQRFAAGLAAAQAAFGCALAGGDTDRAEGPLSMAVTVFGHVPHGRMIRRGAARVGDAVLVSGTIGDSALGLDVRRGGDLGLAAAEQRALLGRYLRPQPRLALREVLRRYATAAMDVSDGLVKDLARMSAAAGVGADVRLGDVPLSAAARSWAGTDVARWRRLVTHGDDYEILCTVAAGEAQAAQAAALQAGVPLRVIGSITSGTIVDWAALDGAPIRFDRPGWDHF
jgi:thiamine-monophosphate kinase